MIDDLDFDPSYYRALMLALVRGGGEEYVTEINADDPRRSLTARYGALLPLQSIQARARFTSNPPRILHVGIRYRPWDGDTDSWDQSFGKAGGQVYSLDKKDPIRSCNEVEVAKLLRTVRAEAYWIVLFRAYPKLPPAWKPFAIPEGRMPDWLQDLHRRVCRRVPGLKGGIPNVVAWDPARGEKSALFVHCQAPAEKVNSNQDNWTAAAIKEGIAPSQFAVAVRDFAR